MPALESLLAALQSVSATLAIALAAWGIGRLSWRWLHWGDADALSEFVWSEVLGLVAGASGLLALAVTGALNELTVAALTLIGLLCAALEAACVVAGRREVSHSMERTAARPRVGRAALTIAAVLAALVFGIGTIAALAPPATHQVLSSSLDVPKNVLLNHGLADPSTELPVPNLAQMWSLWALALDGPIAANLLHAYLAALLAAATVLLARPVLGHADAWFAGCLALLCPGVQQQVGVPLEAIPLALVAALAAGGVAQACQPSEVGRPTIAAGLMLGAAAAIDSAGLWYASGVLACGWFAVRLGPRERGETARFLLQVSLPASLLATPWLLLRLASAASREPQSWGTQHASELLAMLGPGLAIALGGLAFARRLHGLNRVLGMLAAYAVLVVCLPMGPVSWAPLVPLACVAAAWGWCEIQRMTSMPKWTVAAVVLMLAIGDVVTLLKGCTPRLAVACGWESREAFLLGQSGSYRAAAVLNQISRAGQRLLSQDEENLYFSCLTTLADKSADEARLGVSQDVSRRLIAQALREGYTYLLLAEPVVDGGMPSVSPPASVPAVTNQNLANGEILDSNSEVIPILEYRYADDNNRYVRYRLLKLQGPQAVPDRVLPVAEATGADAVGRLPRLPTR